MRARGGCAGQLDLLEAIESAVREIAEIAEGLPVLEERFRGLWLRAERVGTAAAEAAAWAVADVIAAVTGEDRLVLLERLVPDDLPLELVAGAVTGATSSG